MGGGPGLLRFPLVCHASLLQLGRRLAAQPHGVELPAHGPAGEQATQEFLTG